MKNMLITVICIVSFIFVIPAMADDSTKSSIGINYNVTNDGWGTMGSGLGFQLNLNTKKYTDAPIAIRIGYMNLNGTYSTSKIAWDASVIGVEWMLTWENPTKNRWIGEYTTPYAGIGFASININTIAVGLTKSLFSPVVTVGVKLNTGIDLEPYIEFNNITGNLSATGGVNYKF